MKSFKLKPNKQSILGLAGVMILLVIACVALFVKQQSTLAVVRAELESKQNQLNEGNALAARLESTEDLLRQDREQIKFLEASLPNFAYVPTLLRQIEALARDTNNGVRGVRPTLEVKAPSRRERRSDPEAAAKGEDADKAKEAEKKPVEPYDKLKVQLTVTGRYADTLQFLQRLTRFPKIVAVEDLQLRPRITDEGGSPVIDVELNLSAYILEEKGAKPPHLPGGEQQAT
jgi:Tfp pilus assembly protein PilO